MHLTAPTLQGMEPAPGTAIVATAPAGAKSPGRALAFKFGDPEPVLDRRDFLSYLECVSNGRWYEPPIPMHGLARAYDMSPHHKSAILYKRNQLLRLFKPSPWLDRRTFGEFVVNFLQMGNGYLQRIDNLSGGPLALKHTPAIHTRRGVVDGEFWWVPGYKLEAPFQPGTVFHLFEPELRQEIYGIPEWTPALQAGLLNFDATIFRRKYYINGSHAGYILYVSEATLDDDDADAIEKAMEQSKGPGNFRNLFLHMPGGKEKGVQVIPIGEAAAKDEFLGVKNTTRDDILAAHRVPPVLIGVVPQVAGGFGKPSEAAAVFHQAEIEPLMMRLLEINDWLGKEAVAFDPYVPIGAATAAGDKRRK